MHSHGFKLMSISNNIPFRVCGHCQSVLRWYLRLTFDINENYSNGIAKGWGFSYAANLRKWYTDSRCKT